MKANSGGNKPYVQFTADQNEDSWNRKPDQNIALYLQVKLISLNLLCPS